MRATSVYTIRTQKTLLDHLVADCPAPISEVFVSDEGEAVLRFRTAGGDEAAIKIFNDLVGAVGGTLHTGVGVNRREVPTT